MKIARVATSYFCGDARAKLVRAGRAAILDVVGDVFRKGLILEDCYSGCRGAFAAGGGAACGLGDGALVGGENGSRQWTSQRAG